MIETLLQVEGGVGALLNQQAAGVAATGVSTFLNSMWLNGLQLPNQGQLATAQKRLAYGVQMEMQRLQVNKYLWKSRAEFWE